MFCIDGVSNEQIGVVAEEENFISRAPIFFEEIMIEGKDGSDFTEKNYSNVIGSLVLYLIRKENLDTVKSVFSGTKELTYQNRITKIRFYEVNEISRYGTTKALALNFIRDPFWYKSNDTFVKIENEVINEGSVFSKPLIKLVGTTNSDIDITIAGIRFIYHFDEDNEVIIDCETQEETFDGISKSKNIEIGFEYPILKVGTNEVKINSGDCEMYFKRKDAWL